MHFSFHYAAFIAAYYSMVEHTVMAIIDFSYVRLRSRADAAIPDVYRSPLEPLLD